MYSARNEPAPHALADRHAALLIAAVAAAAALAARLAWPFDGLYGQDAFAYFRYASALWPWLLRGEPLPIYYWPAGYPLLVALALPLFGGGSAAGQAISIASLAVAAACAFLLSRELLPDAPGGRLAAWAAGLAVALSGEALRASLVIMSDALAMAGCAMTLWALARYCRTRRWRWLALAAVALAWAAITRWVCGLLAIPMLISMLLGDWTTGQAPRTNAGTSAIDRSSFALGLRTPIAHGLAALALGALIVVPQLLASRMTPVALSQHQWLVSWDIANAWRRDFVTVDGAQRYAAPVAAYYLARLAWPSFLSPMLGLACLPGAVWLARRRRWPALALAAGWPFALWLFLSGIPYQNARFILPALPGLAVLAGLGFGWAYERATDSSTRLRAGDRPFGAAGGGQPTIGGSFIVERRLSVAETICLPLSIRLWARAALLGALGLSLAGGLAWGLRDYRNLAAYKNEQLALIEWTRARLPAGGVLLTFGATLTLQHYTAYDVRELFYLDARDLAAIVSGRRPAYLLLDVGNVETQWVGLRPWQNYHYLQQQPGLETAGQRAPYTLFRIKPRQ
jgi:4-amino-4-deoxy-L-arabinose transferase-like glycosyltransferase